MAVILEVKAGPFAGKRVAVMGGQTVTFGRAADRANFALPHDTFMSGLHFAVECGPNGCRLTDRKSSNGTFVNGARVAEMFLSDGDEVRSGQTLFVVRTVKEEPLPEFKPPKPSPSPAPQPSPPALPFAPKTPTAPREPKPEPPIAAGPPLPPLPAEAQPKKAPPGKPQVVIGAWSFSVMPQGWTAQGEYGIQHASESGFPSSAVVSAEPLGNISLKDYVEAQLAMLRQYLREPRIEAVLPPQIYGAGETVAVEVRYKSKDGQTVFYRRIYARAGRTVGVLTFTTLESDLAQVRPAFDAIASNAAFGGLMAG